MGFVKIAETIAAVRPGPPQFIITVGDQDPAAVTRAQLDAVFGKSFPWYPVVGNHEVAAKGTDELKYLRDYYDNELKSRVNAGPAGTRETTYSFEAGEVHIAVLNQYWNGKTEANSDRSGIGEVAAPLREWLKADLKASTKPWKLVVGHCPAFPQPDKDWDTSRHAATASPVLEEAWKAFWTVLEDQGVAAYVCAHTHRYSRYQPQGSKVWQIDVAQARGDKSWKYDAFVIVSADAQALKFETYRNLKKGGRFEVSDALLLMAPGARPSDAAARPGAR